MKKCKICKEKFTPRFSSLQPTCEKVSCVLEYKKLQDRKEAREDVKKLREKLKNAAYYRRKLKTVLHKYIRLRDAAKPCAACGRSMEGRKGDAGHFWSVGSYPNLQFDEDNIHLCCVPCNQFKGGNLIEYALRLPSRIGQEKFDDLAARRSSRASFTIPELVSKIEYYEAKVKELQRK